MRISSILGLNARNLLFSYQYNKKEGRRIARSKLLSKRILAKAGTSVPQTYKIFRLPLDVFGFAWENLPPSFVLKPSKGLGGEGIIVVKKRARDGHGWVTTQRMRVTIDDLKLHTLDILEGAYSFGNVPDRAFIEEYVGRHKAFRKYAYRGTPDIRIIVFNKVPVMAMLRLPTPESGGRANLHQGAIGVGIDLATGITTYGILHGEMIKFKPETKRKLHGIKIPHWSEILRIAGRCQEISGLRYVGVDIVLHPEKGPMVLELNSSPGLQIQLANLSGLKKRLERVDELDVQDAEHGVKIAKAIFAGRFPDRAEAVEGVKTIGVWEDIKIVRSDKKKHQVRAKIDTGAWTTSIDSTLARSLGILDSSNVLWTKEYKSSLGKEVRKVVSLTFYLAGRKISTIANITQRSHLKTPVIIGRNDLRGFLIKSE